MCRGAFFVFSNMGLKSAERRAKKNKILFFTVFEFLVLNDIEYVKNNFYDFMRSCISIANEDEDLFLECKIIMSEAAKTLNSLIDGKMPDIFKNYVSSGKNSVKNVCYFIREKTDIKDLSNKAVKVGVSDNLYSRIAQFQIGCPVQLELYGFIESDYSAVMERYFHAKFVEYRIHGEWFNMRDDNLEFEKAYLTLKSIFCTHNQM